MHWRSTKTAALLGGVLLAASAPAGITPAAAASAPGTYQLVNAGSGLCLSVPASATGDGVQLAQQACAGGADQTWTLSAVSGGYRLRVAHSGKCAGIKANSTSAGKAVQQQTCVAGRFQTWRLKAMAGGTRQLVDVGSAKCLNVKSSSKRAGALVQQNSCDTAASKRWTLRAAGTTASPAPSPTAAPTAPAGPTAPTGSWPTATGKEAVTATITVTGVRDGGMRRFYGSGALGTGDQSESQPPMFKLADGATLENVIIGAPAADGVHCMGTCTLKNVWWEDVGEDAATFKGTSATQTMAIYGGGARAASDKTFQHNGPGKMIIKNFRAENVGKLYRSCGNCSKQYARHVVISNMTITTPAKVIAGINANYGDTATFSGVTIVNDPSRKVVVCARFKGVTSGEPTQTGSGPDGAHCLYTASDITYK
ncbi:pectate lyase [Nonomuraea basaltis]|uniref:pectate lyase n=1 Tax=Nonomuraea basaltis TaxID=2495887 RepID=UPI00110C5C19|nr:pectate lyase [Nonomuraea basaltis]TMR95969.1 pectate lyase [Nonomuraea basaltis]